MDYTQLYYVYVFLYASIYQCELTEAFSAVNAGLNGFMQYSFIAWRGNQINDFRNLTAVVETVLYPVKKFGLAYNYVQSAENWWTKSWRFIHVSATLTGNVAGIIHADPATSVIAIGVTHNLLNIMKNEMIVQDSPKAVGYAVTKAVNKLYCLDLIKKITKLKGGDDTAISLPLVICNGCPALLDTKIHEFITLPESFFFNSPIIQLSDLGKPSFANKMMLEYLENSLLIKKLAAASASNKQLVNSYESPIPGKSLITSVIFAQELKRPSLLAGIG